MLFNGPDFLPLFMPRVAADDPHDPVALYNLAFIANLSD
jgi:hypothetical protein